MDLWRLHYPVVVPRRTDFLLHPEYESMSPSYRPASTWPAGCLSVTLPEYIRSLSYLHPFLSLFSVYSVLGKRCGIAFLPNLGQSFVCVAVQLEFHDVHVVLRLEHQVNPTATGVVFHLHIETHQLENDVENILVMHFTVARQLVRDVCKHSLQPFEEIIYFACHYFLHKALNLVGRLTYAYRRIVGQQELEEALFHLAVGETQRIVLEHLVVALDGEVAALVDDRNRVGRSRIDSTANVAIFSEHSNRRRIGN